MRPGVHPAVLFWAAFFATAGAVVLLALCGCGGSLQDKATTVRPAGEHPAVQGVFDAWEAHVAAYDQLPEIPQRCHEERERLRLAIVNDDQMSRVCRAYEGQTINGCHYTTGDTPVFWVRQSITGRTRCRLIAHEAVHWLGMCAGVGAYSHSSFRLWPNPWPAIRELVANQCPDLQTPKDVVVTAAQRAACGGSDERRKEAQ